MIYVKRKLKIKRADVDEVEIRKETGVVKHEQNKSNWTMSLM